MKTEDYEYWYWWVKQKKYNRFAIIEIRQYYDEKDEYCYNLPGSDLVYNKEDFDFISYIEDPEEV